MAPHPHPRLDRRSQRGFDAPVRDRGAAGGHVLQDTLFCRNRWLDGAFRIMAIFGVVGLGFLLGAKLLAYLAIPMAIALPVVFKLGKVTDAIRRQPMPPPLPSEDRIPTPTAQAIIGAIRAAFPPKLVQSNKMLAQHTLTVFERLTPLRLALWDMSARF